MYLIVNLLVQLLPLATETWLLSCMLFKTVSVARGMRKVGQKSFLEVLQRDGELHIVKNVTLFVFRLYFRAGQE